MSRNPNLKEDATQVLIKAVKLDQGGKYTEAVPCYREGISKLRLAIEGILKNID